MEKLFTQNTGPVSRGLRCCQAPPLWLLAVLLLVVALVTAGCRAKPSPGAVGQPDESQAVFSSPVEATGVEDAADQPRPVSPVATKQPEIGDAVEIVTTPLNLPNEARELVTEARNRLTQIPDAGIVDEDITLVSFQSAQWPDTSLGCPREGMEYSHVVTPGYVIVLQAKGREYEFHTKALDTVVLCLIDGEDAMKVLQP